MSTSLSNKLNIPKAIPYDLNIYKNIKATLGKNEKCYLGQWEYNGHKISLYTKCDKILAVVQDLSEKTIMLSSKNIKGGVNGKIPQDIIFKMIKCDQGRIALTLHKNRNNHFTLWIIPKLEAAGRKDELAIQKANEYKTQARKNANLYKEHHNKNNFDDSCNQYQKALNDYQKAYDIIKQRNEATQKIETDISAIRKELFLFNLDKEMFSCLPDSKDQNEVKELFDQFMNEEDVFTLAFEMTESTPEEQRSLAENFTCAYYFEFLGNYPLAIKNYLLLARQYYENKGQNESRSQTLSNFYLEKAESLFKKTIQTSNYLDIANFLEDIGTYWLSKTVHNIPGGDYFKSLIEESGLKKKAYEFVKKAQEEANKYNICKHSVETFKNVCKAYEDAIYHLQIAYNFIKKNNSNIQEIETNINKLQKELFEFKLPSLMDLYLPSPEDQNAFKKNLSLLENEKDFLSLMFKLIENLPEQLSLVNNFTCAYAYESSDNPILASHNYLFLSEQYIENSNPSVSVRCLKKAETLIKEKTEISDTLAMVNFLEKLDINLLEKLLKILPNNDPNIEYLEKTLLKKDAIRIAFEEYLHNLGNLSTRPEKPTCFICFNLEEYDVHKWLENTLVPDLDIMGIKPIFCFSDIKPSKEPNDFQGLISQSNLAIVVCTPLLKKKCDACYKNPTGVAQEIRLLIERYNDADKYETIYPIYLKGDRKSSCPSVFLEPSLGTEFSILDNSTELNVLNYYSSAFELFGKVCGISSKKSQEIKKQFLSETKNIIFDDQVDKDKVDYWRKKTYR